MKKQIFGLDISDHSIEAVTLTKSLWGKNKIVSYARTILPAEVVKDGIIKKPDKLAQSLINLLHSAQPKPMRTPYCVVSLPESQVFTAVFKLPAGLRTKEIQSTIPYKAEEVIPFDPAEVYFDFKTIIREGSTQEVFYVAVPMAVVDSYVQVLNQIGLKPVAFDLESVSLSRALKDYLRGNKDSKLLMDIGGRTTNLSIFDRNGVRQSLTVKVAGNRLTQAVAKSLGLPPKEAEKTKIENGFVAKNNPKVGPLLQAEFKKVITETQKFINYYQTENNRQISEIILAGGSALLPGIDQYLADNLKIEVNIGDPLAHTADPKKLIKNKNKSSLFTNVVGLALRGVSKDPVSGDINLLPFRARRFSVAPAKTDKKAWRSVYWRLGLLLVLGSVLGTLFYFERQGYDPYQQVFPTPEYQTVSELDIDTKVLDELRNLFLMPTSTASTTATSTTGLITPGGATTTPANLPKFSIKIKQTATGTLNVRQAAGTNSPKVGQVESGGTYEVWEESNGWYRIKLENKTDGWILGSYATKL